MLAKVSIVDDHKLVLDGLRHLIESDPSWTVVGTHASARACLAAPADTIGDIVIVDYNMPEMNGVELSAQLAQRHPAAKVVLISAHMDDDEVGRALGASIAGIVFKDDATETLFDCLRAVADGGTFATPNGIAAARDRLQERERLAATVKAVLTPREIEIARLAADGMSNKEIGQELGIAPGTVKIHVHSVYTKLGLASRVELANLVRVALRA
ncbi:response regulator transcription factor [Prosthecomicrobium sp. N25]|uniref:response regulator transcription factor n=1 Tax=Prosthecomicrobium sp. N25 TaxID=3129254 RepID=UPI0030782924